MGSKVALMTVMHLFPSLAKLEGLSLSALGNYTWLSETLR